MKTKFLLCLVTLAVLAGAHAASVGTAFTYQGRLADGGTPVSGEKDFQFLLFEAAAGGDPVSLTLTNENVSVTNGLFTTTLDFGTNVFSGKAVWLEIAVRPGADTGAFTALAPRQAITPAPYALVALNLVGPLAAENFSGAYHHPVTISNAANVFAGTFRGNGAALTNLNAAALGGQVPVASLSNAWRVGGNAGTTPSSHFLGTTDNQPLELRVNNARAFRLQPDPSPANAPSILGGSPVNLLAPGLVGATIAGGGSADYETNGPAPNTVSLSYGTVGGGVGNDTAGVGATIGGGLFNQATNTASTVAGGRNNRATGIYSSVGGGRDNTNSGYGSTIGGGYFNTSSGYGSTVGGGFGNVGSGFWGAVGGGTGNTGSGSFATIGGGRDNDSTNRASTVSGGRNNRAYGLYSTVGGGTNGLASGDYSTVVGGRDNTASGFLSTAIGYNTTASGGGSTAMGEATTASGDYSTAMGFRAKALDDGSFVWADYQFADFASTAANQFLIRASGGVGIGHNNPAAPLHVVGGSDVNLTGGGTLVLGAVSAGNVAMDGNEIQARNNSAASTLFLNAGGGNVSIGTASSTARLRVVNATCDGTTWNNASDRNLKGAFEPVDARAMLAKVAALPLQSWSYTNTPGTRHVGPMAQDFRAAFGLGADNKTIATVDADGVALAAIQGLHELVKEQSAELKSLRQELLELRRAGKGLSQ